MKKFSLFYIFIAWQAKQEKKLDADCNGCPRSPLHRPSLSKVVASFSSRKFLFRNLVSFSGKLPCRKTRWSVEEEEGGIRAEGGGPCFALFCPLSPSPPTQILIVQLFRSKLQLLRAPWLFFCSQVNKIALQCHLADWTKNQSEQMQGISSWFIPQ